MKTTTLCFLVRDDEVLLAMKKRGFGVGKYNGVGGKVEAGETILEAMVRETKEEIGVEVDAVEAMLQAELTFEFESKKEWNQVSHVFLVKKWKGEPKETEEMKPGWFKIDSLPFESMWIDDPVWLPLFLSGKHVVAKFLFDDSGTKILNHEIKTADL